MPGALNWHRRFSLPCKRAARALKPPRARACQPALSDFTGGAQARSRATVSLFSPPRDVVSTVNYNIRTTLVLASVVVAATAAAFSIPLDPAVAGTAAYAQTQELTEIKIGALLEFGQSYDDTSSLKAMELSILDINTDPGVSTKYHVTLVPLDITSFAATGDTTGIAGVVQNAVQTQGITHFVGHSSSTVTPAKLVLDEVPGATIISYGSSAPIIPLPSGAINLVAKDSLFRLIPSDSYQAANVVDLVLNKDGKTKVVIVVRQSWGPIVSFLIPPEVADSFGNIIPYTEAERFSDPADAVSSHAAVARTVDGIVGDLAAAEGADKVAVMFIGFPLDFEYHVKGVLSQGDGLANIHDVKWYSTATITGESAAVRDADVAEFAKKVGLSGTRYTVLDNPVNTELCSSLLQQGVICDRYEYGPFAAYDAIHLLVDSIITSDELADDGIQGNDRTTRDLVLDVSKGIGNHHLAHEGRPIGDGALGHYTLNDYGDLDEPATYTELESTTNPANPWVPATARICR